MPIHSIIGGYAACGGNWEDGWYAGVLVYRNGPLELRPKRHEETSGTHRAREAACQAMGLAGGPQRELVLATGGDDGVATETVAFCDLMDGPVAPREESERPVLVWTEKVGDGWEIRCHDSGQIRTELRSERVLRLPAVAVAENRFVFAAETVDSSGTTETVIVDERGRAHSVPGCRPRLAASGGELACVVERWSCDGIAVEFLDLTSGVPESACTIRHEELGYTFRADLAGRPGDGGFLLAAECGPNWGYGSQLGLHRILCVWQVEGGKAAALGGESCEVPVERRAFMSLGPENLPPRAPMIATQSGVPALFFRQFRYQGFKTFGWDLFRTTFRGDEWSTPARVSPQTISPDAGAAVMEAGGGKLIGVLPVLENTGGPARTEHNRVEFVEISAETSLPRFEVPEGKEADCVLPAAPARIAPEPARLERGYPGRRLVWGDLHFHSTYSKCVAAADGTPEEIARYQKEILGCSVFNITDHTDIMSAGEIAWTYDRLELMSAEGISIFGAEVQYNPGRHTNTYAYDRGRFERAVAILSLHGRSRLRHYRHLNEEFPDGGVIAPRHFHGGSVPEDAIPVYFDPRLEVAAEAMQGRCNAMIGPEGGGPRFPNQFLDSGCKLGLLGGSDHFRQGPNRFCLTGFWVRDLTPEGVWEAILNRWTLAMSDGRAAMSVYLGEHPMGSSISLEPGQGVRIRVSASCAHGVRRATLIRDGDILPWIKVGAETADFDLVDEEPEPAPHWYVPTLEIGTAYGDDVGYAHASPYFVYIETE